MAQPNFALTEEFSWEDFCQDSLASADSWSEVTVDARSILTATNLSAVYPFCKTGDWGPTDGAPEMGPMLVHDYHDGILDAAITLWKQATPTVLAMAELWLRLFAGAIAPVGIVFLLTDVLNMNTPNKDDQPGRETGSSLSSRSILVRSMVVILSVSSSVVLATDTLYVFEFGASYGLLLLMVSSGLSLIVCLKRGLRKTIGAVVGLWLLTLYLSWDSSTGQFLFGGDNLPRTFEEGLYHSTTNDFVQKIARNWPVENRTYSFVNGATPWFPTGDSRTGLPFLLNFWDDLTLHEAWVPTVDGEFVRLEFSFPNGRHDRTAPLYLILHGLNGGSQEQFVKDFTHRANADGSTVAIMVARGLMETPVRGWNLFNGARTVDVDSTAKVLRKALGPDQSLIAAGYSMGAIILSNYVARAGKDCPLHGAITVSGGLDMRPQQFFHRARRLWQPFLTITLREQFVVGKMGERYRTRIPRKEMLKLMRATDVTSVDINGVVPYNNYRDVQEYYSDMSAMGDIPIGGSDEPPSLGRIEDVSIPLCILFALDDPLLSWQNVAANEGYMHPTKLSQSGSGNLMLLLTKRGGHVGWPLGWFPGKDKWKWMNGVVTSFAHAVDKTRREN